MVIIRQKTQRGSREGREQITAPPQPQRLSPGGKPRAPKSNQSWAMPMRWKSGKHKPRYCSLSKLSLHPAAAFLQTPTHLSTGSRFCSLVIAPVMSTGDAPKLRYTLGTAEHPPQGHASPIASGIWPCQAIGNDCTALPSLPKQGKINKLIVSSHRKSCYCL